MGKNGVLTYPPNEIFTQLNSDLFSAIWVFPNYKILNINIIFKQKYKANM